MAVFETHQNRHFFVVNKFKGNVDTSGGNPVPIVLNPATDTDGTIQVKTIGDGVDKCMYFVYKGKGNSILTTDKIPLKNLNYAKAFSASSQQVPLRKVEVVLDSNYLDSSKPIAGQDYLLRIVFRQFFGMSDEDQYIKDGVVHATSGMTASNFYKAMVKSLNLNFSRMAGATRTSNPYLKFAIYGTTAAGELEETDSGFSTDTATKIVITEKAQDYTVGVGKQERVLFDVFPTTILFSGDDVIWGTTTVGTSATTLGNGPKIAALEWFCMGERGDQYRMMGYPNYIPTQYMVDPTAEYHVLELHFAFTDWGVDSYRSEKDITIVSPTAKKSELNALISAINAATCNPVTVDTADYSDADLASAVGDVTDAVSASTGAGITAIP